MKHFAIASLCTLAFVACAPAVDIESGSESALSSSSAANETATALLLSLPLPDGWDRYEQSAGKIVTFELPTTYAARKNDDSNDDAFYVFTIEGDCDEGYALDQVELNWGLNVPEEFRPTPFSRGSAMGYQWAAFDGVAGGAEEPGNAHWCVDVPGDGMDIDIAATRSDVDMKTFVEETFIPAWLEHVRGA